MRRKKRTHDTRKRQVQPKRPSRRQLNKAISLLSEWAANHEPVEYMEQGSGLKHPGTISKLSVSSGYDDFMFIGDSGSHSLIFPDIWRKVEFWPDPGNDSVHVTEYEHKYSIHRRPKPTQDDALVKAVKAQLELWSKVEARHLYVGVEGDRFPALSFHGSVVVIDDETYVVKQKNSDFFVVFSMRDVRCELRNHGDHVMVQVMERNKRCSIVISETELSAAELARQFSMPPDAAVN